MALASFLRSDFDKLFSSIDKKDLAKSVVSIMEYNENFLETEKALKEVKYFRLK